MPEVIFNGPEGRLEGRYHHNDDETSPIALLLHPNPEQGGTMNNRVVYSLFNVFKERGFSVLRFNFRGVGRSQGRYDSGIGELSDAASALDWVQSHNPNARFCWAAGYSFGALIGMQLMMRRPEIRGFVSVAPPASQHDFSFLAPCPASGLMIHGARDDVIPQDSVDKLVSKLRSQKNITVDYQVVETADHFFGNEVDQVRDHAADYVDRRLVEMQQGE